MYEAYKAYFGIPVGDQDKPWAPHFVSDYSKNTPEGKKKKVPVVFSDLTTANSNFITFDEGILNSFLF